MAGRARSGIARGLPASKARGDTEATWQVAARCGVCGTRALVAIGASALAVTSLAAAAGGATPAVKAAPGTIASGENHACALLKAGTVKCWGLDNSGQLGNGGSTDVFSMQTKPVSVIGLSGVTAIAAGDNHTCALLKAGTVKCWGLNDAGQLGNGTLTSSSKPVSVKGVHGGGLLTGVIALAAGQDHTCALLSAGAGTVKCWGQNNDGVLGNGSLKFQRATTPQSVAGLTRVVAISSSINDTCVVLKGGSVECWGFDEYGEFGPGTYGPGDCPFGDADFGCSPTPVMVKGIAGATAVSVREHSSCALVKNGNVTCWGDSNKGFIAVKGITGGTAITSSDDSASFGDYTCVLLTGATVKCWGYNLQGQLGNGTMQTTNVPTSVTGLSGVTVVSAGVTFACARLASGSARCWGANNYGQLGNGGGPNRAKPVPVVGI